MRKNAIRLDQLGSLLDEPGECARKILLACIPATMSFWIDDRSIIRAIPPGDIPSAVEPLIIGTYSIVRLSGLSSIQMRLRLTPCDIAQLCAPCCAGFRSPW